MEDFPQGPMDDLDYHGQTHKPHFGAQHKKSKKKMWLVAGIIAAVMVIAGGVVVFLLMRKSSGSKQPAHTTTTQQHSATNTVQQPGGVQIVNGKYYYKSTKLNIAVTYPKTWNLRESADKQELILTSPSATYVKKGNVSTEGVFTLKLRNGIIPEGIKTTVANATAVDDSVVVAYAQPTGDQRQYTNLSYLGPDANNFSFALITGYTSYKAGQAVGGGVDLNGQAYMFGGGFGADTADSFTFDQVPKTDYNTQIFKDAVGILESIQIY